MTDLKDIIKELEKLPSLDPAHGDGINDSIEVLKKYLNHTAPCEHEYKDGNRLNGCSKCNEGCIIEGLGESK